MIAASTLMAIGSGLLTTFNVDTPTGTTIGYLIVYGLGMGMSAQSPLMVAQNVLPLKDIPIGSGMIMFTQQTSGYSSKYPFS